MCNFRYLIAPHVEFVIFYKFMVGRKEIKSHVEGIDFYGLEL